MPHPFDAVLKEILGQQPADMQPVFGLPAITPAERLNVDLSTVTAATDLAIGFGSPLREIADLNFQSGPDPNVAARLLVYNAIFHMKYMVPVRSILVLLRPKADVSGLDGNLTYACGSGRVEFRYDVVRLWQQPVEPFLSGGIGLLPLATLCKMPKGKRLPENLREVVRQINRRLAELSDHAQAVRLMNAAFILTGMRVPKESLASIYDGVKIMHKSTAYDTILDEGREEGILLGTYRVVLRQGRKKFGAPNAKTHATLKAIADVERLERMADAVLSATSWQELLATK